MILAIVTLVVFLIFAIGSYWAWGPDSRKSYLGPHVLLVFLLGALLWTVFWRHIG